MARYGGEEFAILLCHAHLERAAVVAERMREKVAGTPLDWEGKTITLTVGIGVSSTIPTADDDMKGLIQSADDALYAAKRAGRNRVLVSE